MTLENVKTLKTSQGEKLSYIEGGKTAGRKILITSGFQKCPNSTYFVYSQGKTSIYFHWNNLLKRWVSNSYHFFKS